MSPTPTPGGVIQGIVEELSALPTGLEEASAGLVYAETDGAVVRIDLHDRRAQRIAVPRLGSFRSFVATSAMLAVKQVDDGVGFLVLNDAMVRDLPGAVGGAGRLYPAGPDGMWVVPEEPRDGRRVMSLFEAKVPDAAGDLTPLGRRVLPATMGIPAATGSGELISRGLDATYVVTREATELWSSWEPGSEVIAVGAEIAIVRTCARCDLTVHPRTASATPAPVTAQGIAALDRVIPDGDHADGGRLSVTGRFLALPVTDERGDVRLTVVDLTTGDTTLVGGALTRMNANDQFAWLPTRDDRWLLAVTDQRLHVLDMRTGSESVWDAVAASRVAVVGS